MKTAIQLTASLHSMQFDESDKPILEFICVDSVPRHLSPEKMLPHFGKRFRIVLEDALPVVNHVTKTSVEELARIARCMMRMYSIQARIEAMLVENSRRSRAGNAPAYGEQSFLDAEGELRELSAECV